MRLFVSGWENFHCPHVVVVNGTFGSFVPGWSPTICSPPCCCHRELSARLYITRLLFTSFPETPKVTIFPLTVLSNAIAVPQSGQKVTSTGVPPTTSLTISCRFNIRCGYERMSPFIDIPKTKSLSDSQAFASCTLSNCGSSIDTRQSLPPMHPWRIFVISMLARSWVIWKLPVIKSWKLSSVVNDPAPADILPSSVVFRFPKRPATFAANVAEIKRANKITDTDIHAGIMTFTGCGGLFSIVWSFFCCIGWVINENHRANLRLLPFSYMIRSSISCIPLCFQNANGIPNGALILSIVYSVRITWFSFWKLRWVYNIYCKIKAEWYISSSVFGPNLISCTMPEESIKMATGMTDNPCVAIL